MFLIKILASYFVDSDKLTLVYETAKVKVANKILRG